MSIGINNNTPAQIAPQTLANTLDSATANASKVDKAPAPAGDQAGSAILSLSGGGRALDSVTVNLNRAATLSDVASAGAQTVSSLLSELKAKALGAVDTSATTASRQSLNADYQNLLGQIQSAVDGASFGGTNLLNGSQPGGATFVASADGGQLATLSATNLSLGGPAIPVSPTSSIATATAAADALNQIDTSQANVSQTLGLLGVQARQVAAHVGVVAQLNDALDTGVGALVNANLGAEGVRLQALQVQQQLAALPQSIVNQTPQTLLSLFR